MQAVVRMKIEIRRSTRNFVIFVAILVVMMQGAMALKAAVPPEPSYITDSSEVIDVDGNIVEWDLTNDYFADMYKAAKDNKAVLSKLYIRYDCENGILYAMVLLDNDYVIDPDAAADNHFIKVNESGESKIVVKLVDADTGDDDDAPDFHYILNSDDEKIGWEASTDLPVGSYKLNVHTQVYNDETSAVEGRDLALLINCGTNDIPEFPTIALPVAAILGLMFIFGRKKDL